jgi:integrase
VKRGKTPVLSPEEARRMLDAIDVTTHAGDRALIALMVYSFARIGAALAMKVEDVFVQNRRLWVRLREKGGKRHEMPCHHNLETYLHAYLDGSGIAADPKGPLFRTIGRTTGQLTRTPPPQANAHAMIRRRAGPDQAHRLSRKLRQPRRLPSVCSHQITILKRLHPLNEQGAFAATRWSREQHAGCRRLVGQPSIKAF